MALPIDELFSKKLKGKDGHADLVDESTEETEAGEDEKRRTKPT